MSCNGRQAEATSSANWRLWLERVTMKPTMKPGSKYVQPLEVNSVGYPVYGRRALPALRERFGKEGNGAAKRVRVAAGAEVDVPQVRTFVGRLAPSARSRRLIRTATLTRLSRKSAG